MPQQKRITHRDVARLAGVSTATVSYVVNNGPRSTSSDVRKRVLQAVAELNYHPSALARSLRAQRTFTVGYVASDYYPLAIFTAPYSSGLLTGLVAETKAQDHSLLVYSMGVDEDMGQLERLLRSGRLDAVVVRLVQRPPASDALLELVKKSGLVCVCLETAGNPRFGFPSVTIDDFGGAYDAVRYLIAAGHTRIGHIRGDLRYVSALARVDGYKHALQDAGLPVDQALIDGNTWLPNDAVEAMNNLLSLPNPPTAIFAANDSFAFVAVELLRSRGYRIPEDIAIIGFDDIPTAQEMRPALTSVHIPLVEMGRKAVQLALSIIDGTDENPIPSETMRVELIRRETA